MATVTPTLMTTATRTTVTTNCCEASPPFSTLSISEVRNASGLGTPLCGLATTGRCHIGLYTSPTFPHPSSPLSHAVKFSVFAHGWTKVIDRIIAQEGFEPSWLWTTMHRRPQLPQLKPTKNRNEEILYFPSPI